MADVYGAQRWLASGLLPANLVHGHCGYLRPLHGVRPGTGRFLHLVACDLACTPEGHWQLVALNVQAPAGLGWLLQTHLAPYFRTLLDALQAPKRSTASARVLLTPGPYAQGYAEHLTLAQGLGLTLAQGCDLQLHAQRLVLHTLDGAVPVQSLIAMVDDAYLDPLELRADSTLGVPGLVQALRQGWLTMANLPGAAFLDNLALLPHLPGLARAILGHDFRMAVRPSAAAAPASCLRVFALADDAGGWRALPAGLLHPDHQRPGTAPEIRTDAALTHLGSRVPVLRRTGENLFWVGRYGERATQLARLALLGQQLLARPQPAGTWAWLERMVALHWQPAQPSTSPAQVLDTLLGQTPGADPIAYNLRALQLAAFQVRERFETPLLERIERLLDSRPDPAVSATASGLGAEQVRLQSILEALALLVPHPTLGAVRDAGWELMALGQHLERLAFLSQALQLAQACACLPHTDCGAALATLFAPACDTVDAPAPHDRAAWMQRLVRDPQRPHSLAYVTQGLRKHWLKLEGVPSDTVGPLAQNLPDPQRWPDAAQLAGDSHPALPTTALESVLQQCQQACAHVGTTLSQRYFDALGPAHVTD